MAEWDYSGWCCNAVAEAMRRTVLTLLAATSIALSNTSVRPQPATTEGCCEHCSHSQVLGCELLAHIRVEHQHQRNHMRQHREVVPVLLDQQAIYPHARR